MSAILCLTRGDDHSLKMLKNRNKCISQHLIDKTIPNIIFHEGNISLESQEEIKNATLDLDTKFVDVTKEGLAFCEHNKSIPLEVVGRDFGYGYRHMCHFWFVDFWKFVKNYKKIIRIDDDCSVKSKLDSHFQQLDNYFVIAPKWVEDHPSVTQKLNSFTEKFLQDSNIKFDTLSPPGGPYTNFLGLNLVELRKNQSLAKFINAVEASGNIYRYRWGDLPLWGKTLEHFLSSSNYCLTSEIKYFHGSHNSYVNVAFDSANFKDDKIMFNNKRKYH